nr:PREDICTED: left-right determination factor 1-like [Equus przewalskii]
MQPMWLCWALWALPLTGPGAALTEEQILGSLLQQLHLSEMPALDQGDVGQLVIPTHVRAQYVALLQRSHGAHSRGKRFSQDFRVRFASQGPAGGGRGEPQLELHSLDLGRYGAQGDCDPEAPVTEGTRCCRREMYIDLEGLKWAENWVLEPPGFLAYECVGTCRQPPEPLSFKWPFLGPRQCIASETTSLPVIVSVKEGGRPRAQVVSLPDMRVQKCSCASDGAPVPRKLEP